MDIKTEIMKLKEEISELEIGIKKKDIDNIIEELADCFVALLNLKKEIQKKYNFKNDELTYMMLYKEQRTNRRIEEGYYEKQ